MVDLDVMSPVARTLTAKVPNAMRLPDLTGKTIGLYWNKKPGGEVLLARTAELLQQRFSGIKIKHFEGSAGMATMRHLVAEDADRVAKQCDAVIAATSD